MPSETRDPLREVDRLRYRMQRVRRNLDQNVEGLRSSAEQLLDWRYHLRRHPWGVLGAAMVAGFLIIPRRNKSDGGGKVYLDPDVSRKLAEVSGQLQMKSEGSMAGSLLRSVGIIAANAVVRAGIAYLGQKIGQGVSQEAEADRPWTKS